MVHRGVGAHDLAILHASGTSHGDVLLQNEPVTEERVSNGSSGLLDDVDVIQIGVTVKTQHGIHGQLGEVLLVLSKELGAQRSSSNI